RLKIAERLSAQRPAGLPPLAVCIQVNLAGEAGKSGVAPAELPSLAQEVARLPRLALRGLMALPPEEQEAARQRHWFRELRLLRDALVQRGLALDALSMGMSGDFEAAIAEGATHLRIGSALFGPRPPPPSR
ncbi:MAG TPA: YggS family pyridoxal phosphate-dependent enzyme, partial [Steroidobacteraceae bacterium]